MNPVSLQLDLDSKFQLQDITMDFKVRFLGVAVDGRGGHWATWAQMHGEHSVLVSSGWGAWTSPGWGDMDPEPIAEVPPHGEQWRLQAPYLGSFAPTTRSPSN